MVVVAAELFGVAVVVGIVTSTRSTRSSIVAAAAAVVS